MRPYVHFQFRPYFSVCLAQCITNVLELGYGLSLPDLPKCEYMFGLGVG